MGILGHFIDTKRKYFDNHRRNTCGERMTPTTMQNSLEQVCKIVIKKS